MRQPNDSDLKNAPLPDAREFPKLVTYSCSRCLILAFSDGKHLCGDDTHYTGYDVKVVYLPDKTVRNPA